MGSKSGFSFSEWLRARYPYDVKARSKEVEQKTLDYFSGRPHLKILDLGSGIGANTRYYATRFPCSQEWTLLEIDRRLTEVALRKLKSWTFRQGRVLMAGPSRLTMESGDEAISICTKNRSFFELKSREDISNYDLITANAFFDLIPLEKFTMFASILSSAGKPLLATLNFISMNFDPGDRADRSYISLYESHMTRPNEFGPPMGPRCGDQMVKILGGLGFSVYSAKSTWKIPAQDKIMMNFMFGFLDGALSEMITDSQRIEQLGGWKRNKFRLLGKKRLQLTIEHLDLFAQPKVNPSGRQRRVPPLTVPT